MNKWFPLIFSLLFLTACGGGTESSDGAKDEDSDKDTIINSQDNCPNVPNTNQLDSNGNGVGDACEGSQTLREKALKKISEYAKSKGTSSPPTVKDYIDAQVVGVTSESLSKINQRVSQLTESDVDTVSEIQEILKELNISAPSADFDGDGIKDSVDNCPSHANPDQKDSDSDSSGDVCDLDNDNDGVVDKLDNCPLVSNSQQKDLDKDGAGDACDSGAAVNDDTDADGVKNNIDNCPAISNPNQADLDNDGKGDACDSVDSQNDTDGDGVKNNIDNCPAISNPNQADIDNDGKGDACDSVDDRNTNIDEVKPITTLNGEPTVTISVDQVYKDAGATANDDVDGDISSNIQVSSTVNTKVVGTYKIKYNVQDLAGNVANEITRLVIVYPNLDINKQFELTKNAGTKEFNPEYTVPRTQVLYASPTGNSKDNCENINTPCSVERAQSKLYAGATLLLRGGVYSINSTHYRWMGLKLNLEDTPDFSSSPYDVKIIHGNKGNPITIKSYPGELAIFDGGMDVTKVQTIIDKNAIINAGNVGLPRDQKTPVIPIKGTLLFLGDYYVIKNIEIRNMGLHGIQVQGSHNIIENINSHRNVVCGIKVYGNTQLHNDINGDTVSKSDAINNIIRNSIFHNNSDAGAYNGSIYQDGNQADGINITVGAINTKILNNRIYNNADDGLDTYVDMPINNQDMGASGTEVAYNIVYENGLGRGDGNGIKFGSWRTESSSRREPVYIHHNLSFKNRRYGYNYNVGGELVVEYNTAVKNKGLGFSLPYFENSIIHYQEYISYKHNISFQNLLSADASQYYYEKKKQDITVGVSENNWQEGLKEYGYNFLNADVSAVYSQNDLNKLDVDFIEIDNINSLFFLNLSSTSQHQDKGAFSQP